MNQNIFRQNLWCLNHCSLWFPPHMAKAYFISTKTLPLNVTLLSCHWYSLAYLVQIDTCMCFVWGISINVQSGLPNAKNWQDLDLANNFVMPLTRLCELFHWARSRRMSGLVPLKVGRQRVVNWMQATGYLFSSILECPLSSHLWVSLLSIMGCSVRHSLSNSPLSPSTPECSYVWKHGL